MRSGQYNLGIPDTLPDLYDESPYPVTPSVTFRGNLFGRWQQCLSTSYIDHHAPSFKTLHNPVYELKFPVLELLVDEITLRILHLLYNDLSCRLSRYPSQIADIHESPDTVAKFRIRIKFQCILEQNLGLRIIHLLHHVPVLINLHFTGIVVIGNLKFKFGPVTFPHSRLYRLFQGIYKDVGFQSLLPGDLFYYSLEFYIHTLMFPLT